MVPCDQASHSVKAFDLSHLENCPAHREMIPVIVVYVQKGMCQNTVRKSVFIIAVFPDNRLHIVELCGFQLDTHIQLGVFINFPDALRRRVCRSNHIRLRYWPLILVHKPP